jgi:hypothetical protein
MKTTLTAWIYPKAFIDATNEYDPYIEASKQAITETIQ